MAGLWPNEDYPHLSLLRAGATHPRRKRSFPGHSPKYPSPEHHGADLSSEIAQLQIQRRIRPKPVAIDPSLILKVKLNHTITDAQWQRSGLTLIGKEHDHYVVLFASDNTLQSFRQHIDAYTQGVPDGKKNPHHSWIDSIDEISIWTPADRRGQSLDRLGGSSPIIVDIEFWSPGSKSEAEKIINQVRQEIDPWGGVVLDDHKTPSGRLVLAKIAIPFDRLPDVLEWDSVYKVELPPIPQFSQASTSNLALDDLPEIIAPPEDAIAIGILDSGIISGHPLLGPAVKREIAVLHTATSPADQHGHGTMVAGIALYGDIQTCVVNRSFQPQFWILSARVTNAQNEFDDEKLIITQMEEAMSIFANEDHCRIFNISLGDEAWVFAGQRASAWAALLDELARSWNAFIVVSAGNYRYQPDEIEQQCTDYPDYLLSPAARIISPAEGVNVLTVGALAREGAPDKNLYISNRVGAIQRRAVAKAMQPAPFSRSGPGINNMVKPDLVAIGGNLVIHLLHSTSDTKDSGVACCSFNRDISSGNLFAFDSGTSFAAPNVTHIAACLKTRYPDISANMIRAILVAGATVPQATRDLKPDLQEFASRVVGHGHSQFSRSVASTGNRVILIHDGCIEQRDSFQIFEVPMVPLFLNTTGKRQIEITLAFDPPVNHRRSDYAAINMQFRLFRNIDLDQLVAVLKKDGAGKKLSTHMCNCKPGPHQLDGLTLQHAVLGMRKNPSLKHGDTYYLVVTAKHIWGNDDLYPQRYALVVTLEHERNIEMYQLIQERVRQREQVQEQQRIQAW